MTKHVIHVMFGDSGAGILRKAIEMGQRDEIVVAIEAKGDLSLMHESEIRLPGGGTAPVS